MAYYKKQPTAFTQGLKGKLSRPNPEDEIENGSIQPTEEVECANCGKFSCTCSKNDWENKL